MRLYLVFSLFIILSFSIQSKEINNWSFNTVPIPLEHIKKFTNIDKPTKIFVAILYQGYSNKDYFDAITIKCGKNFGLSFEVHSDNQSFLFESIKPVLFVFDGDEKATRIPVLLAEHEMKLFGPTAETVVKKLRHKKQLVVKYKNNKGLLFRLDGVDKIIGKLFRSCKI